MSEKGQWGEAGDRVVTLSFLKQQVEALLKLREILEGEVDKQKGDLRIVREQLHRMKHGGGS